MADPMREVATIRTSHSKQTAWHRLAKLQRERMGSIRSYEKPPKMPGYFTTSTVQGANLTRRSVVPPMIRS